MTVNLTVKAGEKTNKAMSLMTLNRQQRTSDYVRISICAHLLDTLHPGWSFLGGPDFLKVSPLSQQSFCTEPNYGLIILLHL